MKTRFKTPMYAGEDSIFEVGVAEKLIGQETPNGGMIVDAVSVSPSEIELTVEIEFDLFAIGSEG